MVNQLEFLCERRGIKVEFIAHKFIDSASELKNSKPIIKVHKIFKECPMKVATAVVEIFTGEGYTSECIEIIESYLREKFGPVGINVQPPKVIITRLANKGVSTDYRVKKENYYSNEEMYIEADISSIDVTSIKNQQKKLNDNETLSTKEQDILELDIVVRPPLHN